MFDWTKIEQIPTEFLGGSAAKEAYALNARASKLIEARAALDKQSAQFRAADAASFDLAIGAGLKNRLVDLLRVELALRQDVARFAPTQHEALQTCERGCRDQREKARADVTKRLTGIGYHPVWDPATARGDWRQADPCAVLPDWVGRHPDVHALSLRLAEIGGARNAAIAAEGENHSAMQVVKKALEAEREAVLSSAS